uniref:Uncharacterized protein n=1 Tax=Salix viminalis TaxID=40686 RepID=A0A6N2LNX2_SALVM
MHCWLEPVVPCVGIPPDSDDGVLSFQTTFELIQATAGYGSAWPAISSSRDSYSSSLISSSLDFSSSGAAPMSSGLAYFSQYSG